MRKVHCVKPRRAWVFSCCWEEASTITAQLIFSILACAWRLFFERSNGGTWRHRRMDWRLPFITSSPSRRNSGSLNTLWPCLTVFGAVRNALSNGIERRKRFCDPSIARGTVSMF
ncbi:uncharacterized protein M421DRAFT_378497 [Didymella exigua CBS 183.55]|uniref:Uncharacterized protein n=1 Tax=Didymella exigua CBS 183.55 TaxID=1150837 RepID=A0A6A5RQB3_9PLEO|nr:uncharacterized protein M421DRAFT_378497 [Didymella exigua CBS 183.55]KAF1930631.1 hypothetical protein M421DRAFT_378497 [Didymella exigua CBS 183.55]